MGREGDKRQRERHLRKFDTVSLLRRERKRAGTKEREERKPSM